VAAGVENGQGIDAADRVLLGLAPGGILVCD